MVVLVVVLLFFRCWLLLIPFSVHFFDLFASSIFCFVALRAATKQHPEARVVYTFEIVEGDAGTVDGPPTTRGCLG